MNLKLIDCWQNFWRFWSIRFTALGSLLLGYIAAVPDALSMAWSALPDDAKTFIPPNYLMYISLALFVIGMFSRIIKQEKLNANKSE